MSWVQLINNYMTQMHNPALSFLPLMSLPLTPQGQGKKRVANFLIKREHR